MRNSSIAIVLLGLTLAGCVPQQQREMVQATTICLQAVYDSPEGAPLRAHQPFNVRDASLAQLANPAFATPAEVAAITAIHPRYQACQKELLDRMSSLAPSEAPIFAKHFRNTDDDLLSVVQRRMTWGDFTRRPRDRSAASQVLVVAEERRLAAEDQARATAVLQELAIAAALRQATQPVAQPTVMVQPSQPPQPIHMTCRPGRGVLNCSQQ